MITYLSPDFSVITAYILSAVIAAVSVVTVFFSYRLLNAIPARWLCDYDEEPTEEMLGKRYEFRLSGIFVSALLVIVTLLCFFAFGYTIYTLFSLFICYAMLLIIMSDAKYSIIPDQFTAVLAIICVAFSLYDLFLGEKLMIKSFWDILLGAVCGSGTLLVINILSILIFKKEGMGFGDVKLMAPIGAMLGFPMVFASFFIAVMTAGVYIVFLLFKKLFSKSEVSAYFPFGPFLCIGAIIVLLFQNQIEYAVQWYVDMLIL